MKLQTNTTIDGKVVEAKGNIGGYEVFLGESGYLTNDLVDDEAVLYFVDESGQVVGSIKVEAGMGQGCGYIADVVVKDGV
jgi:hypothetical protein